MSKKCKKDRKNIFGILCIYGINGNLKITLNDGDANVDGVQAKKKLTKIIENEWSKKLPAD